MLQGTEAGTRQCQCKCRLAHERCCTGHEALPAEPPHRRCSPHPRLSHRLRPGMRSPWHVLHGWTLSVSCAAWLDARGVCQPDLLALHCCTHCCGLEGIDISEQAVEARTTDVCGVDMSPVNLYRWTPAFAAGGHLPGFDSLSAGPSRPRAWQHTCNRMCSLTQRADCKPSLW